MVVPDQLAASRAVPHVNNIEYLRWVDRVAELHARSVGMSREALLGRQRMWFVARHELEYRAECWPGQRLGIATWVESVKRAGSWRGTLVWREDDERVIFKARTNWVLVDILSRRPVRIEPDLLKVLDVEQPATPSDDDRSN